MKPTQESKKKIPNTAIVCMVKLLDINEELADLKFMKATQSRA